MCLFQKACLLLVHAHVDRLVCKLLDVGGGGGSEEIHGIQFLLKL